MIPRAPRSTLFPYTTLFRSELRRAEPRTPRHRLHEIETIGIAAQEGDNAGFDNKIPLPLWEGVGGGERSEEHTSELQSHSDLVCRLLLEKKNKSSHHAVVSR